MLAAFENLVIDDLWKDINAQIQLNDEHKSRYEQKLEKICNRLMEKAKQHDPTYRSITKIKSYLKGDKTLNKSSNDFKLIFTNFNKYYSGQIPYTFERYQYFTLFFLKYFKTITQVVPKTANEYDQLLTNLFYDGSVKQDLDETITEKKIVFNNDNLEYLIRLCGTKHSEKGTVFFSLDYVWCSDAYLLSNDISYERNNLFFIEQFKSIFDKDYYSYLSEFESEKLRCFSKQSIVDDLYEVFIVHYLEGYSNKISDKKPLEQSEVERLFFYFCFIYCSCNKEQISSLEKNNGIDLLEFNKEKRSITQICRFFNVYINEVILFYKSKKESNSDKYLKLFSFVINSIYDKIDEYIVSKGLFYGILSYRNISFTNIHEPKLLGYYSTLNVYNYLGLLPQKLKGKLESYLTYKTIFQGIDSVKLYIPNYCFSKLNTKSTEIVPMSIGKSLDDFVYCVVKKEENLYIMVYDSHSKEVNVYKALIRMESNSDVKNLVASKTQYFSIHHILDKVSFMKLISVE